MKLNITSLLMVLSMASVSPSIASGESSVDAESSVLSYMAQYCKDARELLITSGETPERRKIALKSEINVVKSLCDSKSRYKKRSQTEFPEGLIVDFLAAYDSMSSFKRVYSSPPVDELKWTIVLTNSDHYLSAFTYLRSEVQTKSDKIGSAIHSAEYNYAKVVAPLNLEARAANSELRKGL